MLLLYGCENKGFFLLIICSISSFFFLIFFNEAFAVEHEISADSGGSFDEEVSKNRNNTLVYKQTSALPADFVKEVFHAYHSCDTVKLNSLASLSVVEATFSTSALTPSKYFQGHELLLELYRHANTPDGNFSLPISNLSSSESLLIFRASDNPHLDSLDKFNAFFAANTSNQLKLFFYNDSFFIWDVSSSELIHINDKALTDLLVYLGNSSLKVKNLSYELVGLNVQLKAITVSLGDTVTVDTQNQLQSICSNKASRELLKTITSLRKMPGADIQSLYVGDQNYYMFSRQGPSFFAEKFDADYIVDSRKFNDKLLATHSFVNDLETNKQKKMQLQQNLISTNLLWRNPQTRIVLSPNLQNTFNLLKYIKKI